MASVVKSQHKKEPRHFSDDKRPVLGHGSIASGNSAPLSAAVVKNDAESRAADIWFKCPGCKEIAFRKEVERNLNVCLKCGYHLRLTVEQRLAITVDRGTWRELFSDLASSDPLSFVDSRPYRERLDAASRSSGSGRRATRTTV